MIWGDLRAVRFVGGAVDLGIVQQIACGRLDEGYLYDSLNPDPGQVDFILVRETGVGDYGTSSDGQPREAATGDCP